MSDNNDILSAAEIHKDYHSQPQYRDSPDRDVLTLLGVQILFQVGEKTIYRLIDEGLPCRKVGQSYRFVRTRVIQWLEDESSNPAPG